MGGTPDRFPGTRHEDEIVLDPQTDGDPTEQGALKYVGGEMRFRDAAGVFNPRTGGSGITAEQHRVLRQLIHFVTTGGPAGGFASGAFYEALPVGPFPTTATWWESNSKVKKIVELTVAWTAANPTEEKWEMYDTDGVTVIARVTDTITYTGAFESGRTRAIWVA